MNADSVPDMRLREDQEHIDRWLLIVAYAWDKLNDYREIPESVRGELVIGWSNQWLESETE